LLDPDQQKRECMLLRATQSAVGAAGCLGVLAVLAALAFALAPVKAAYGPRCAVAAGACLLLEGLAAGVAAGLWLYLARCYVKVRA
jgi:hypothetical protein